MDQQEEFEVKHIDGEQITFRGTIEYLIKWQGYSKNERTQETIDNVQHTDELIADWHAQQQGKIALNSTNKSHKSGIDSHKIDVDTLLLYYTQAQIHS